jgi:processive 1,2-diacylglycerol beta-glucosyltransferase
MPKLYDQNTGAVIGDITEAHLQFLVDQLEEEGTQDRDYYINRDTLALFRDKGADPALVEMLDKAMGDGDDVDIEWR